MSTDTEAPVELLRSRIEAKTALIGIVGMGSVALPLGLESGRNGYDVVGHTPLIVDTRGTYRGKNEKVVKA